MSSLCLYFKVHQPYQLKPYAAKDVCVNHLYEDRVADRTSINRVADECYLPANAIIEELIYRHRGQFKVNFSISGIVIELLQQYRPDVIASFKQLIDTGCVEILAETYFHSLSFLHSKKEFERQVTLHSNTIKSVFEVAPMVFRNTELIYNNKLAEQVAAMGYSGLLCDGFDSILDGRSANKVYNAPGDDRMALLIRNGNLSDDIAFRFNDAAWREYPLTAEKFVSWISGHDTSTEVINLFMDYETFGIHKQASTGIFHFLEALPAHIINSSCHFIFSTASEVIAKSQRTDIYDVPQTISWEDKSKHESVWCTNVMQNNTIRKIYSIEKMVMSSDDDELINTWGRLQSADYYYYMATNHAANFGQRYLNPYHSPQDIFSYFTNIITDFEIGLIQKALGKQRIKYSGATAMLY